MSQRTEFIALATAPGANVSELCRRFGISRKTGNKWLRRFREGGAQALADRSRKPKRSPRRTKEETERQVLELRDAHPVWGGRKLKARLKAKGLLEVPSASTITTILRRHDRLSPEQSAKHTAFQRFERDLPNELWQMDFKGHFDTASGRCNPLTILDDHSRYALCLEACANQQATTVQEALVRIFERYGLPDRILCDNGAPWGDDAQTPHTRLTVWLIRLGVKVVHGRPYHPQTQGKEERFHRTLKAEVLAYEQFKDLTHCQLRFDRWRNIYNHERPHEALGDKTPAERYRMSKRPFPGVLLPVEYGPDDHVRKVQVDGRISFQNRVLRVGRAFAGQAVALRPTRQDGEFEVYFCHQKVAHLDLCQVHTD